MYIETVVSETEPALQAELVEVLLDLIASAAEFFGASVSIKRVEAGRILQRHIVDALEHVTPGQLARIMLELRQRAGDGTLEALQQELKQRGRSHNAA